MMVSDWTGCQIWISRLRGLTLSGFFAMYIYIYIRIMCIYIFIFIYIDRFRIHGILGLGSGVRVIAGRTAQGFEFWESVKRSLACCFPPTWI